RQLNLGRCRGSFVEGERQREARASAPAFARRLHGTAVLLGQSLDQGETQSEAAARPRERVLCLRERLEQPQQHVRLDANAGVDDLDLGATVGTPEGNGDRSTLGRELRRVVEE